MIDDPSLPKPIQDALAQLVKNPKIRFREPQVKMMAFIYEAYMNESRPGAIRLIEAPTGTGKSLGYLIPGILAGQRRGMPLVISTGTVALQEQIIEKDIPFILSSLNLSMSYALAKGRSRYFCERDAIENAAPEYRSNTIPGFGRETAKKEEEILPLVAREMLNAFRSKEWNGDLDTWEGRIPGEAWQSLHNNRHTCGGRNCFCVTDCPYFVQRKELEGKNIIVTNHDLVLADFSNASQNPVLPRPDRALYAFDEGHHLTTKAISHSSHATPVQRSVEYFSRMGVKRNQAYTDVLGTIRNFGALASDMRLAGTVKTESPGQDKGVKDETKPFSPGDGAVMRFREEKMPPEILRFIDQALASNFLEKMRGLASDFEAMMSEKKLSPTEQADKSILLANVNGVIKGWSTFLDFSTPKARWVSFADNAGRSNASATLHVASLLPSDLLRPIWEQTAGCAIASATIRALGSFDHFIEGAGLRGRPNGKAKVLPSPFDFHHQAELCFPTIKSDPKDEKAYTEEISQWLGDHLPTPGGSLVFFTSKKQMKETFERLPENVREQILLQEGSRDKLLKEHKNRVDRGNSSVIFATTGFSEGLDLPGDYCKMVVVTRIPFSVPSDPVEEARVEYEKAQGGNPFQKISLPEASFRLTQMAGRLIRTESDEGVMVLLDNRMTKKWYGAKLMAALPPFRRIPEKEFDEKYRPVREREIKQGQHRPLVRV
ncbi:MAG: hypothetical protein M0041_07745 [Nitrospiraceae bacterium]|nr:hypothetical protein [Nitrospiraceae bacterium]